jgi:hypothetical protein
MGNFTGDTSVTGMNATLQQSCQQARDEGIIVYGIAFEAPANGVTQIAACASSASRFFAPVGAEISGVFNEIAADIQALRLTQ